MDPRALNELLPDWKEDGAPIRQFANSPIRLPVTGDEGLFRSKTGALRTPGWLVPLQDIDELFLDEIHQGDGGFARSPAKARVRRIIRRRPGCIARAKGIA